MAAKPVQISVEVALLERIDADPETRESGRSTFIRSAVRHYLREKQHAATDARRGDALDRPGGSEYIPSTHRTRGRILAANLFSPGGVS